jgi:hypothetical protein
MTDPIDLEQQAIIGSFRAVHTSIRNQRHTAVGLKCPCCGAEMTPDRDIGASTIFKCSECGLSDSVLKEKSGTS